jgi:hypothetical protein
LETQPLQPDKVQTLHPPNSACRPAIYATEELGLTFHPSLSSRDCCTCSMVDDGDKIFISSVYLHCLLTAEEPAWIRTINKASMANRHYLAGIDSNSHSDVWGSPTTDQRGHTEEEILFQHNLCVLHEGSKPTFDTARDATCIDIIDFACVDYHKMDGHARNALIRPPSNYSEFTPLTRRLASPARMPPQKSRLGCLYSTCKNCLLRLQRPSALVS